MKPITKKLLWHMGCVIVMLFAACVFFSPVFQGKVLIQGDQQKAKAMVSESVKFAKATGEYSQWNSAMFSGMPSYQTAGEIPRWGFFEDVVRTLFTFRSSDFGLFFFYMLAFYIALVCFGLSPFIALLGAIGFGFGSYNLIVIHVGHLTKARCMAMILPIYVGMVLCFRAFRQRSKTNAQWGTMIGGGILFAVALTLQISFSHIQITYYTMLGALVIGLVYLVYSIKEKWIGGFALAVAILLLGAGISVASNARTLFATQEYAKYTMRGGSEISITPAEIYGSEEYGPEEKNAAGLNLDYAYEWSYGIGETYTLLVPGARGGGSSEQVSKESDCYKALKQQHMPLYWGSQPFTEGPVYFGAIIVFLFILGLLVVKGPEKWWLLLATILSIMLAWGRNFMPFNEWMFNYMPFYNKFRTPSMALTLANVAMVFMAVLAVKALIDNKSLSKKEQKNLLRPLYIAAGITGGLLLLGLLFSGGLSYSGLPDDTLVNDYGEKWTEVLNLCIQERKAMYVGDVWRSLLFVALSAGLLWLYVSDKMKKSWLLLLPMTLLVLIDLWNVDRRNMPLSDFVNPKQIQAQPAVYDAEIDKMALQYGDKDYRVMNLAVNTFGDAQSAIFHHQIGGYSAIKLRRYQDVIDFYLTNHIIKRVLAMLNARYIVTPDLCVQRNEEALGNAWFVQNYQFVPDPNAEILALRTFKPATTAVVDSSQWAPLLAGFTPSAADPEATIEEEVQTPYNPGYIRYRSHSATDQLAVFSEVYYKPDWFAYIDGQPADYFRANYILRAMIVPAGDHLIEFRNEAPLVHKLNRVALISQILFLLLIIALTTTYYLVIRKRKTTCPNPTSSNHL